ncbi:MULTISPECIES: hydroxyethylthiazole kinase [unclassified Beijerinckia]|uniref:hydroxyethylthiazole kinase n=1 Tax=unclassified Beijerinckia TaxID=2638183 RepID=UPI000A56AEAE|nr:MULTISPECIES: hydroxyethylthiazole kinase [unclassified Beijerinckia]MDH7794719.1 hydroxyethylthiazole kinase [Beijerinckia sp. GAS462]
MDIDARTVATRCGALLDQMRAARPLVQNITNYVSMDIAANALLAVGASPAMVHAPEESPQFVALAGALVINIGTLSAETARSAQVATTAARQLGRPWLFDPVGVGATDYRNDVALELMENHPAILRGNASEIMAIARLAGLTTASAAPRGVDSANTTSEAELLCVELAQRAGCVVVATGEVDVVTDGQQIVRLANGSPLMTRVTALGCSLSSVMGAFLAIAPPFDAAIAALAVYGVAGDIAAETTKHPGSFRVAFIDALDAITPADIATRLKVQL